MKRRLWVILSLLMALVSSSGLVRAASDRYAVPADRSEWLVQGSKFECRLEQPITDYGQAVFYQEAGERLGFYLLADSPKMAAGEAAVTVRSPVWKPGGAVERLAYVPVKQDRESIALDERLTHQLMQELYGGKQVEFTRRAWFDQSSRITVGVSTVNFRGAYDKYRGCLAELLPVNYGQIQRTSLLFKSGQETLTDSETSRLDDILEYVAHDTDISAYYIDGHTDSQGTRADNLEISKRRAELVRQYLVDGGVDSTSILTRWHGERYPVASNRSADGRAKNRRVTLRLSREPLPEMVPAPVDTQAQEEQIPGSDNAAAPSGTQNDETDITG